MAENRNLTHPHRSLYQRLMRAVTGRYGSETSGRSDIGGHSGSKAEWQVPMAPVGRKSCIGRCSS